MEGCNYNPCQPAQGGFLMIFMPHMDSAKRCSCKPTKCLEVLGWFRVGIVGRSGSGGHAAMNCFAALHLVCMFLSASQRQMHCVLKSCEQNARSLSL